MAWTPGHEVVWGEWRPVKPGVITVQPPATPTIATTYVRAYEVLGDERHLGIAQRARDALRTIQSEAGGMPHERHPGDGPARFGTFDDDTTTGTLDFFIALYETTGAEEDRQAVESVGAFVLKSQYENGGWPQYYPLRSGYHDYITFNDNAMTDAIRACLKVYDVLDDEEYLQAAIRGGECIIRLQGPGGGWAQQYHHETLEPAWARKFEPPGYSPAESVGACDALIDLAVATGDEQFLKPLPRAFQWYEDIVLPNGKRARLYEPETGRPVYGRRDKAEKVYDFENATSGYSWQGNWYPTAAKRAYERIQEIGLESYIKERESGTNQPISAPSNDEVEQICGALTKHGFWLSGFSESRLEILKEQGINKTTEGLISARSFVQNAKVLLDYVEASPE